MRWNLGTMDGNVLQSKTTFVESCAGVKSVLMREKISKYLFFGLKERGHARLFCFCMPSCLIATRWQRRHAKETNPGVAPLLQCEIYIF